MKEIIYILPALCIAYIIINLCFHKSNNFRNFSITIKLYHIIFGTIIGLQSANIYNFLSNNFAIYSVYSYSNADMSVFYKISAGFSGMGGSFLLWLTCIGIIGIFFNKHIQNIFYKSKNVFLCSNIFILFPLFLSIALIFNNCFELTPTDIDISDGLGLKLTLQSYYNLFHPPLIFIGFSILYIPYVISFSTLLSKADIRKKIIIAITFWNKLGILFLLCGIVIGSLWAYNTLGWGGFWGWDPIENAALIPLLLSFALLHIDIIRRKISSENTFLKTFFLLCILIFPTIILCTFLVRSGLLVDKSVHSYIASSSNVVLYILCFLLLILIISLFLFAIRIPFLNTFQMIKISNIGIKNNINIFGVIIIICTTFMVLTGIIIPIIANNSLKIDSNFYMLWGIPLGAMLLLLLGGSALLKERKHSFRSFIKPIIIPFVIAIITSILLFLEGINTIKELVFLFAGVFAIISQLQSLITKVIITKKIKLNYLPSFLSHIGFAIFLTGAVLYGAFREDEIIFLEKDKLFETKSGFQCAIIKVDFNSDKKYYYTLPIIEVKHKAIEHSPFLFAPKIVFTKHNNNDSNNVAAAYMFPDIFSIRLKDIYIEPINIDVNNGLLFSISVKPYIKLVWIGFGVLLCGLIISLIIYCND